MKTQLSKLDFKKESIVELVDSKLYSIEGGTLIVTIPKSIFYPTTNTPTFNQ